MRHHLLIAGAIFAVILNLTTAKSQEFGNKNVQALYAMCNQKSPVDKAYCLGFISGAANQMFWLGARLKEAKDRDDLVLMGFFAACPKTSVSNGAVFQAFINWVKKHPEEWSDDTQLGVIEAIRATWPCFPDALKGR